MKLMIVGSRSIKEFDLTPYVPEDTELIISGGAVGADEIAEEYADRNKISKLIIRPRYDVYGRGAPLIRNKVMVDIADEVIVIWDGKSRGSSHVIDYAKKQNKNLMLLRVAKAERTSE